MSDNELFERGVEAIESGMWLSALSCFEKLVQSADEPVYLSYYASCVAKERGQYTKAAALCAEALEKEPANPVHYLCLGRVYLFQGKKTDAISAFRDGLRHGEHSSIIRELSRLGTRKPPVFRFLPRDNPINKFLGIVLGKMGLRQQRN